MPSTRRMVESRWGVRRWRSSHMNSIWRTSERGQYQIELGLQLCDPNALNAQLLFSIGKALVYGPERVSGGGASNCARSGRR